MLNAPTLSRSGDDAILTNNLDGDPECNAQIWSGDDPDVMDSFDLESVITDALTVPDFTPTKPYVRARVEYPPSSGQFSQFGNVVVWD